VPVYDYICSSCSHRFEVFRGLNEAGPHQCPLCEGPVTRAFVPPTIHFKGSGWAKVDRRSTGAPTKSAPAGEAKGSEAKDGEAAPGESTSKGSSSREPTSVVPASRESTSAASPSTSSGNGD
jgi:putative FmdB family regulatory protein